MVEVLGHVDVETRVHVSEHDAVQHVSHGLRESSLPVAVRLLEIELLHLLLQLVPLGDARRVVVRELELLELALLIRRGTGK